MWGWTARDWSVADVEQPARKRCQVLLEDIRECAEVHNLFVSRLEHRLIDYSQVQDGSRVRFRLSDGEFPCSYGCQSYVEIKHKLDIRLTGFRRWAFRIFWKFSQGIVQNQRFFFGNSSLQSLNFCQCKNVIGSPHPWCLLLRFQNGRKHLAIRFPYLRLAHLVVLSGINWMSLPTDLSSLDDKDHSIKSTKIARKPLLLRGNLILSWKFSSKILKARGIVKKES